MVSKPRCRRLARGAGGPAAGEAAASHLAASAVETVELAPGGWPFVARVASGVLDQKPLVFSILLPLVPDALMLHTSATKAEITENGMSYGL